jgi:hypothetical protein
MQWYIAGEEEGSILMRGILMQEHEWRKIRWRQEIF